MWVKQCHKPPMWECFIPPIYGDLGDGLLLFYPHYSYGGFHGAPIAALFISWKKNKLNWMIWGYPHFGKPSYSRNSKGRQLELQGEFSNHMIVIISI